MFSRAWTFDTLQKAGLTHCDVKAKNCVRVDYHIKMIDLDATSEAAAEGETKDNAPAFVGEEFSSDVFPPETVHQPQNKKDVVDYKDYFSELLEGSDPERRNKVQPMANRTPAFAVKTYLSVTGDATEGMDGKRYIPVVVKNMDKLPYNLVVANESVDLWLFVLMVNKFETGVNFFKID